MTKSSLYRLFKQIQEHDVGFITAYRSMNTRAFNQAANKKLFYQLRAKDFGVTKVRGIYIEYFGKPNAKEVEQESFFVVNLTHRGDLQEILEHLGNEYDQDSILFVPKGGLEGLLIGTNKTGYPGFGEVSKFAHPVFDQDGKFIIRVNHRPFIFIEGIEPAQYVRLTSVSKRSIVGASKQPIESFIE